MIALDRPKVNALDVTTLDALSQGVSEAQSRGAAALVITGNGRAFSAGLDLKRIVEGGPDYIDRLLASLGHALRALFECPLPVIAAVNGAAVAGGCVVACTADVRLAGGPDVILGASEVAIGTPLPALAIEIMREACGLHARELLLGARLLPAAEAVDLGLLHEVVEADVLMERALGTAAALGGHGREAFAMAKQQLRGPAIERANRYGLIHDEEVRRVWCTDSVLAAMRAQLAPVPEPEDRSSV